jgi:hypothetical protein
VDKATDLRGKRAEPEEMFTTKFKKNRWSGMRGVRFGGMLLMGTIQTDTGLRLHSCNCAALLQEIGLLAVEKACFEGRLVSKTKSIFGIVEDTTLFSAVRPGRCDCPS